MINETKFLTFFIHIIILKVISTFSMDKNFYWLTLLKYLHSLKLKFQSGSYISTSSEELKYFYPDKCNVYLFLLGLLFFFYQKKVLMRRNV